MKNKLVVITGASSGFGAEAARVLSSKGYYLALLARRVDKLRAMNLENSLCFNVDVACRDQVFHAIRQAEEQFGDVDCIINNAGVMLLGELEYQDHDEWNRMIDTNIKGVINGMQAVLPSMRKRKTGTIINISSLAGQKTYQYHAAYCATKFAVHGLSESVRWEVAPDNVRVITISPGAAETELINHISDDFVKNDYINWKESIGGAISEKDVVDSIIFCYELPQSVCVRDLKIAPTRQQN
ncbi:SDR family oxidoreductase [Serratia symbiotica]|uniref:SDR family oxidoreductase n=1 Tax=Serratia symbiotica TaxID=138074 RepID=UPI0013215719|nr:SDR family oxidoreductase [Serratia symbiotica]MBF1994388.1 SDR family oxidoreductase [Serratia symbiotica]QTP15146.1 SDR family oxidoreductase [Serratia symbiotica]